MGARRALSGDGVVNLEEIEPGTLAVKFPEGTPSVSGPACPSIAVRGRVRAWAQALNPRGSDDASRRSRRCSGCRSCWPSRACCSGIGCGSAQRHVETVNKMVEAHGGT